jgi:sortase A
MGESMSTLMITTISPAHISRRGILNALSVMLIAASLMFFGNSIWIFAKAQLAQVLLERAFTQSILRGKPVKAWSWADTYPVARIKINRINAEAIVLNGSSGQAMAFGPALVNETSRPGTRGTSVMAAHRDTHFSFLKNVQIGDLIEVERDDGLSFTYRATQMRIVDWNKSGIDAHAAGFNLVLATCYPFEAITHGPKRFIVEAELVK